MWARKRAIHVGTWASEHVSTQSVLARDHLSTQGTWARKDDGTWTRKHTRQVGKWARKAGEHVFSTQGTQFSRLKKIWLTKKFEKINIKIEISI